MKACVIYIYISIQTDIQLTSTIRCAFYHNKYTDIADIVHILNNNDLFMHIKRDEMKVKIMLNYLS